MPDATNGRGPASADEFDRELRELTEGTAGEPMFFEPSAAERARAQPVRVRPIRRRRGQLTGPLFLMVVLLAGVSLAWLGSIRFGSGSGGASGASGGPAASAMPGPLTTPELTGTVAPVDLFNGPPPDPFARTPADHWADGAAGIVAPAAKAVGTFTAEQVATAYAVARDLLIAANLDRQTLLGGPPAAFARLLTRAQRATFLAGLDRTGTDKLGNPLSTRTLVASFAPGSTQLIGHVIKVHGTMAARTVTRSGTTTLAIDVNYLFVYGIEPPHDPTDWMPMVDHEYGDIDFARWPDAGTGALQPWDLAPVVKADIQCGAADGYIHPAYPSDRSIDSRQSGPSVNPYSTAPPPRGMACDGTADIWRADVWRAGV